MDTIYRYGTEEIQTIPLVIWFTAVPVHAADRTFWIVAACVLVPNYGGGKAQIAKYPTMLLTVRGRKTGKSYTTPLIYIKDKDRYVIAAAYSGSDKDPFWWRNLQSNPEAELQVMNKRIKVRAEKALPDERETLWQSLSQMYPYFADYEARTTRQIPVIVLTPVTNE